MKKYRLLTFFSAITLGMSTFYGFNAYGQNKNNENITQRSETVDHKYEDIYNDENKIANNINFDDYSNPYPYSPLLSRNSVKRTQKIEGYYGIDNYWVIDAKEDGKMILNYDYNFNENGVYQLFLYTPDNEIVKIFGNTLGNGHQKNEIRLDVKKGITKIVAFGHNASAESEISIETYGKIEIKCKYQHENANSLCPYVST